MSHAQGKLSGYFHWNSYSYIYFGPPVHCLGTICMLLSKRYSP